MCENILYVRKHSNKDIIKMLCFYYHVNFLLTEFIVNLIIRRLNVNSVTKS